MVLVGEGSECHGRMGMEVVSGKGEWKGPVWWCGGDGEQVDMVEIWCAGWETGCREWEGGDYVGTEGEGRAARLVGVASRPVPSRWLCDGNKRKKS